MRNDIEGRQNHIAESFKSFIGKEELLAKVIECFPYPIEVYDPNGTTVLVNKAILDEYHVSDPGLVVGKYNIFKDPAIICSGQLDAVKRALRVKLYFFMMLKYLWKKLHSDMAYGIWIWMPYIRTLRSFRFLMKTNVWYMLFLF